MGRRSRYYSRANNEFYPEDQSYYDNEVCTPETCGGEQPEQGCMGMAPEQDLVTILLALLVAKHFSPDSESCPCFGMNDGYNPGYQSMDDLCYASGRSCHDNPCCCGHRNDCNTYNSCCEHKRPCGHERTPCSDPCKHGSSSKAEPCAEITKCYCYNDSGTSGDLPKSCGTPIEAPAEVVKSVCNHSNDNCCCTQSHDPCGEVKSCCCNYSRDCYCEVRRSGCGCEVKKSCCNCPTNGDQGNVTQTKSSPKPEPPPAPAAPPAPPAAYAAAPSYGATPTPVPRNVGPDSSDPYFNRARPRRSMNKQRRKSTSQKRRQSKSKKGKKTRPKKGKKKGNRNKSSKRSSMIENKI